MDETRSGSRMRIALIAAGVIFFFIVGLAGGAYFNSSSNSDADLASAPSAGTTNPASAPAASGTVDPGKLPLNRQPRPPRQNSEATTVTPRLPPPVAAPTPAPPQQTVVTPNLPPAVTDIGGRPSQLAQANRSPDPPAGLPQSPAPSASPPQVLAAPKAVQAPAQRQTVTAHAAEPRVTETAGNGPFHIQFGAFSKEENAQRLVKAIQTPRLKVTVTPGHDHQERLLYYVQSAGFRDLGQAQAAARGAQAAAQAAHIEGGVQYVIRRVSAEQASGGKQQLAAGR